jgi:hypothetical protein
VALASTVLDEIGTTIEGVSVVRRGRNDGMRRVRSVREITAGERQFTVTPASVPEHTQYVACNWRRMAVDVQAFYADTEAAVGRVVDDGEIIDTAIWGLLNTSADIVEVVVDGTSVDADDGLLTVTWTLFVTYDTETSE